MMMNIITAAMANPTVVSIAFIVTKLLVTDFISPETCFQVMKLPWMPAAFNRLITAVSITLRSLSAASHILASKPRVSPLTLLADLPDAFLPRVSGVNYI